MPGAGRSRSASGTPSIWEITSIGTLAARSPTKSKEPDCRQASRCETVRARMSSSIAATRRGVKPREHQAPHAAVLGRVHR
jgi:hypothetical protein